MQKTKILFLIVGSLVGIGIVLFAFTDQLLFEGMIKQESELKFGENMVISADFDNYDMQTGVYAIQVFDLNGNNLKVHLLDPNDSTIVSEIVGKEIIEGQFEIKTSGSYKLVIENLSDEQLKVYGIIGPEPDPGKKALVFISQYTLTIGLVGIIVVGVFTIFKR